MGEVDATSSTSRQVDNTLQSHLEWLLAGLNGAYNARHQRILDGRSPEEVVREWPHLTLAMVHGALAYYYDHQPEIDADIEVQAQHFARARDSSS